jgi:transposase-like protein
VPECPKCGGKSVVRNGHQSGKQQYLRKECGSSFAETTGSAAAHSHSGETVWKQVARDTIEGKAIDETAAALDLHRETVFNMRHKILYCLEQEQADSPKLPEGVCEADETYVLESVKGRKIPGGYHRKARKHGAKAQKRGLSEEYVCVRAAAERHFQPQPTGQRQAGKNFSACSGNALTAALFYSVTGRKITMFSPKRGNV